MEKTPLRTGFTTGTASSAAAKAAIMGYFGENPEKIDISLPIHKNITIPVFKINKNCNYIEARIIKDGGDDPDATHEAEIGAKIIVIKKPVLSGKTDVFIKGGKGVGLVTKKGLAISPGNPAINPVPLKMITNAALDALNLLKINDSYEIHAEIFVEKGEEIAKETLNERLGIMGGISILGTTGIVKPFSNSAYMATIQLALKIAKNAGISIIVLTTGSTSERTSMELFSDLPKEAFVMVGDYIKFSMEQCQRNNFNDVRFFLFFGKALKIASGLPNTHASKGDVDLAILASFKNNNDEIIENIINSNTAREAYEKIMENELFYIIEGIGNMVIKHLKQYAPDIPNIKCYLFDYENNVIWQG